MRYLSFLLAFCFSLSLCGQPEDLQRSLTGAQGQERADILIRLSNQLEKSQPEKAEAYAEEALDLSDQLDYHRGIIASAFFLGNVEKAAANYRKAARLTEKGIETALASNDPASELEGLALLGAIYQRNGQQKKLSETLLRYRRAKTRMDLAGLKEAYESQENALEQTEAEKKKIQGMLAVTAEEKLQQEAALERLAKEKAELELKTLRLENEATKNTLAMIEKENEILQYDARLRRQQFLQILMVIGFVAVLLIVGALIWYYKQKRERAEEKMRLQQQLRTQEKMAALGQLTAGIAHEIKNPLNFVNNFAEGSSELAQDLVDAIHQSKADLPADQFLLIREIVEDLKQNARDILNNGRRLDRIVNSMMEHARGDKGHLQPIDLNELIDNTVNLVYHGFRALDASFDITVEKNLSPALPKVNAIPQDLSRVLLNILNNACYAVNQKRKEIGETYTPLLKVSTRQLQGAAQISIWDNGPGIPAEIRQKIFTPFFTTKPTGKGNTGLGLSISYDLIVQGHKGQLLVESDPGKFTRFIIQLPLQEERVTKSAHA